MEFLGLTVNEKNTTAADNRYNEARNSMKSAQFVEPFAPLPDKTWLGGAGALLGKEWEAFSI